MRAILAARRWRHAGLVLLASAAVPVLAADRGWPAHGGDPGHQQYSRLKQINRSNVGRLRTAWVYRSGGASTLGRSQIQCSPIVVDGVLYATGCNGSGVALNPWLGTRLARMLLGDDPPSFAELRHRPIPLRPLEPLYLPLVGLWFRWQDRGFGQVESDRR